MRIFIIVCFAFSIISCGGNSASGTTVDLTGYTTSKLSRNVTLAQKFDTEGKVIEQGYVSNGQMNGVWLSYHPDGRIKTLTTYVNNLKTGPFLEFYTRGQIEKEIFYDNGELNGKNNTYKSGRFLKEANYKDGKLHGDYREYFESGRESGKIQKLIQFKDGQQHGKLEYYNAEGEVTLAYEYKNGVKVE